MLEDLEIGRQRIGVHGLEKVASRQGKLGAQSTIQHDKTIARIEVEKKKHGKKWSVNKK